MFHNSLINEHGKYLQSAPVDVRLAGFTSTTTQLQNQGWQISVEQLRVFHRASTELRVAFKHDGIKQVAMGFMEMDERRMIYDPNYFQTMIRTGINITYMAPMIRVLEIPFMGSAMNFQAIDARPNIATTNARDLSDFAMFKPIKSENFEIYINEKDEQEIMELLLKKQDPKQKEIRQNMKRRSYFESQTGQSPESLNLEDKMNTDIKHQIVLVA